MSLPQCQAFDAFALHVCKYPKLFLAVQTIASDTTVASWEAWKYPPHLLVAGFPIPPLAVAAYVGNIQLMKHFESCYRAWCAKSLTENVNSRIKWHEYDVAWWTSEKKVLARKRMSPQMSLLSVACGERGQMPLHYAVQGWSEGEYDSAETLCEIISLVARSDQALLNVVDYRKRCTALDLVRRADRSELEKQHVVDHLIRLGGKPSG